MLRFFLSIKTFLWLTGISIFIFFVGSFFIPQNLDIFSEINDMPLFRWLSLNSAALDKSFWIYLLIGLMSLLGINIFICTGDALIKKMRWKGLLEVLSPQILHIGVMFVLLGHLISAVAGYKEDVPLSLNELVKTKGFEMMMSDVEFVNVKGEDSSRWRVSLNINDKVHMLEPVRPAFYNGVGFFAKSVEQKKMKAIIGLVYDPGVLWEILGAVIFVLGAAGISYARFKEETWNQRP